MLANGHTVIQMMEQVAPKRLAMPEDAIGLQLGTLNKPVSRVLVTLDVTEEVVDEAIASNCELIIAHHAIIFRPLKNLVTDRPAGRLYEKLIKQDIAVYIAHTNLDIVEQGMNDRMAQALGLQQTVPLSITHRERLFKLVVFVPVADRDAVMQAIFAAGAGQLGAYSECSFQSEGIGSFRPGPDSSPHIGKQGQWEQVQETKVEVLVTEYKLKAVVQKLKRAHPYEEPAYDLIPLELPGPAAGLGRVGRCEPALSLRQLAEQVKLSFDVSQVRVVGDLDRVVQKIAVLGGAGRSYVKDALFAGADVLITGDIDFHTAQDAKSAGLALIDPGHHAEKLIVPHVVEALKAQFAGSKYELDVRASLVDTDPFTFI